MRRAMKREIHIRSYFSLPTDLAKEMRDWTEFVAGEGYSVELKSPTSGEAVTVRFIENAADAPFVAVAADEAGPLFDRVLGRFVYALSENSDDLVVEKYV